MKNLFALLTVVLFGSTTLFASTVGIVDSGTFFGHELLKGREWFNADEIIGNIVDDDKNGKVDDIHGWNFAEDSEKIFFPEHAEKVDELTLRVFELLAKIEIGALTEEDRTFWNEKIMGLSEEEKKKLTDQMNFFGQYAHGTHCSGVVAMGNEDAKIMSARMFPDTTPPAEENWKAKAFFALAANLSNKVFFKVSDYLKENEINVANYSIGVPMAVMAKNYLASTGNKEPKEEEVAELAQLAFKSFKPKGEKWIKKANNTLFVIAAGNDGKSNDILPIFPAAISVDNAITVAASKGYKEIAQFSNFSPTTVHVAAPGVAINSTVPTVSGDLLLPMSGTSMAAPFVSMVASKVKDANMELTPKQIKDILIGTVDKKEWLKDKVLSSGIVNEERAVLAASFIGERMTMAEALEKARAEVEDKPEVGPKYGETSPLEIVTEPTKEMIEFSRKIIF